MKTCYNLFVGLLITVLYFNCTNAAITYPCPAGCFCIGTGSFEPIIQVSSNIEDIVKKECEQASAKANGIYSSSAVTLCDSIAIVSSSSRDAYKNIARSIYYTDDFSVYYNGSFGFYGFKNDGEFVYFLGGCNNDKNERSYTYSQIYNCPESFPNSDKGSKSLADCFRYNADGDKVYYGDTEPRIKTKLIDYNGWVPLVSCQPGYYMPANSTKCSSCSGNNACPGGMFYTDKTYSVDRGIIACENGVSSDRTSCRANGTTTTATTSSTPPATTTTNTTPTSQNSNNNSTSSGTTNNTSGGNNTNTSQTPTSTDENNDKTNNDTSSDKPESKDKSDPNADIKAKIKNGGLLKWFGFGKSATPQTTDRVAIHNTVPTRGTVMSPKHNTTNYRSATGTNDTQRPTTLDKAVRENPRGTNKSNRN